jgi:hypothetical protein
MRRLPRGGRNDCLEFGFGCSAASLPASPQEEEKVLSMGYASVGRWMMNELDASAGQRFIGNPCEPIRSLPAVT